LASLIVCTIGRSDEKKLSLPIMIRVAPVSAFRSDWALVGMGKVLALAANSSFRLVSASGVVTDVALAVAVVDQQVR
jgi:hypothetical protein